MGGIGLEPTLRTNYAIRNFGLIVVPSHLSKLVSCCQSVDTMKASQPQC